MKWNNICIFFFKFFPHLIIAENWVEFPVLYSRSMLVIYFKYQFSSVTQSCLTPYNPMDCSSPGFPVHHQLLELAQTRIHWVGDVIQPSHPLSSPSPPAFNLPQHQGLFKWVHSLHQVVKVLEFRLQHQSFQWMFRTDLLAVQGTLKSLLQHHSSKASAPQCLAFFMVHLHRILFVAHGISILACTLSIAALGLSSCIAWA